ncbi:MAG: peptidase [Marinilabiliaceae bacterium]|nr:peptidase [Marinilabiliaceae bacterium]
MLKQLFIAIGVIIVLAACEQNPQTFETLLASDNDLVVDSIAADTTLFEKARLVWFKQPIDHNHPEKGYFRQRVWVSHRALNAPVVMVTEGYAAPRNYTTELARLLEANQIIVEHRYFDKSVPENMDWKYLTVEQAANDHHRIIQFFQQLYKGKWATTGISKGGQTTIFHRAFFPNDVDVSVPYVAPINLAREDQRLFDFFHTVGTEEERQKIKNFQKKVFEKREELVPLFREYAESRDYTFRMGEEKAFDLVVLEYPFSFWQWGSSVDNIPGEDATVEQLFAHLQRGSDIGYVSDQEWERIKPFFYQAYKELGYYAYVPGDFKSMLKGYAQDTISSSLFAPGGDTLRFIPETMHWVMEQLKKNDPKIVAIVGENDPWGCTSLETDGLRNTLKAVQPGGSHRTRINTLPDALKQQVSDQLKEWMK